MSDSSGLELLIRWMQLIISLAFPVAIAVILWLIRGDFHRWVEDQIKKDGQADELDTEIQEFID
jgi:hypothetical protein